MKKFLLFVVFAAVLGSFNQAKAQCNGASVFISNIVITNVGLTYSYSYNWRYISGNASIIAVLKCGGVVVVEGSCNGDLKTASNSNTTTTFLYSGSITFPSACAGLKQIEFRIHASQNCNGNFCPLPPQSPLPVSFASFTAARNRANVNVSWSTASEQNNSGFVVERNINGLWEPVGNVASKAVNGNSDALLTYSFSDLNNTKGITQYRIKQIDFDSKSKYSEVRSVRGDGQKGKTIIYPNPSTDGKVNVVFEETNVTRDISVTDMAGRTVKQMKGLTNNNITIDNLNPGMYTLRVLVPATGDQTVEKIIVNKR